MENKKDYIGYEDQELCNQYWKEAEKSRREHDYPRLRTIPAPSKNRQLAPGEYGPQTSQTRIKYVSISGMAGEYRL